MTTGTPIDPQETPTAELAGAVQDTRCGVVAGERACAACGFSLFGQPIVRESHYGMLMVRCPECGGVAALQEYPALGRWARRWVGVLAAGWLLVIVVHTLITAASVSSMAAVTRDDFIRPLARHIGEAHRKHQAEAAAAAGGQQPYYWNTWEQIELSWIDNGWWNNQQHDDLLAAVGGTRGATDLAAFRRSLWMSIPLVILGIIWSLLLLNVRRRRMLPAAVIVCGASWLLAMSLSFIDWSMWYLTATQRAAEIIGAWPVIAFWVFAVIPVWLGMALGRPIARGLVRAALPPALRAPLVALWTVDGLPPPRVRG